MSENQISHSDPNGSNPPVGVDLLGQAGSKSEQFDPRDFSNRSLQTIAILRQSISHQGGQPV